MTALAAAAIAAFGDDGAHVLRLVGGELGAGARAAIAALRGLEAGEQRHTRARWAATARAPVPAGVRGIHASWIEAALDGEPARARTAMANGGLGDGVDTWLARRVCAALPSLPLAVPAWPRSIDDAIACDGETLARWLAEVGADQLALALVAAGGEAIAGAATRLGPDGARLIAAATRIQLAPRAGQLGLVRAAIARCRGIQLGDPHALALLGARAIAPYAGEAQRARLALRLPRAAGLAIARELAAHADDGLDRAPAWAALGAPP